ncbi:MAG: 8-oxoguanine DNA glycosylase [Clostridia bacterium]|nr:8-oxoguanine DNA glycosylase [Clostridia bacterium]
MSNVKITKDMVIIENLEHFDPVHVFECGQCFRWNKENNNSYTGVAFGKVINVSMLDHRLIIKNTTEEDYYTIWEDYFDLKRDYKAIKNELSKDDEIMKQAIDFGKGIRLLNQNEWETVISFIISQNKSIPIIKQNIEALSRQYGRYLGNYWGKDYYDFPSPEKLAGISVDDILACKVGYRAKYIKKTACEIAKSDHLYHLKYGSDEEAEAYLLGLHGIGPKVANCIMLFSLNKYQRFPIDVWVERVMKELYQLKDTKSITQYVDKTFQSYGGFAQQYLFYYAREKKIGKK